MTFRIASPDWVLDVSCGSHISNCSIVTLTMTPSAESMVLELASAMANCPIVTLAMTPSALSMVLELASATATCPSVTLSMTPSTGPVGPVE